MDMETRLGINVEILNSLRELSISYLKLTESTRFVPALCFNKRSSNSSSPPL